MAMDTIDSVQYQQKALYARTHTHGKHMEFQRQDKLYSLSKELKGIKRRSESLGERLQNEINVVSLDPFFALALFQRFNPLSNIPRLSTS